MTPPMSIFLIQSGSSKTKRKARPKSRVLGSRRGRGDHAHGDEDSILPSRGVAAGPRLELPAMRRLILVFSLLLTAATASVAGDAASTPRPSSRASLAREERGPDPGTDRGVGDARREERPRPDAALRRNHRVASHARGRRARAAAPSLPREDPGGAGPLDGDRVEGGRVHARGAARHGEADGARPGRHPRRARSTARTPG